MRLIVTGLLLGVAQATITPDTEAVCSTLHSKYPDKLVWDPIGTSGSDTWRHASIYNNALFDYWNAASSLTRPACTFFPSNAKEASYAVKTLIAYPEVKYAVKSGGHSPNLGFANIDKGVLIAFRPNSKYAIPSPDGKTIDVGAGCKWEDVYSALEPLGKTVVGGRLGDVGVTGLILGGGLSYLSAQYGLACDNVVSFECVLANGTIVNASEKSHPDLYFALRGGGNQFAIVTKFVLKTYDIGRHGTIWGGVRTFGVGQHSKILSAISNFTANNKDPKAAIIPTFNYFAVLGLNLPGSLVFFFYDGGDKPEGVFDEFLRIPALSDTTKSKPFTDLTKEVLAGDMKGLRFQIRENTFPNMPLENMTAFLNDHFSTMNKKATESAIQNLIDFSLLSFAVQPMPKNIQEASQKYGNGGNALGLNPKGGDKVWIEYDAAWLSPLCDKKCPQFFTDLVNSVHDLHVNKYSGILPTHYEEGDLDFVSYNPIFMNDAMHDQEVLKSYGNQNYQRLKRTHQQYDPDGFLARQNGFKFDS